jgi:hypothetical protein
VNNNIKRVITKVQRDWARDFVDNYHSYIKWSDRPSRKLYWLLYENSSGKIIDNRPKWENIGLMLKKVMNIVV